MQLFSEKTSSDETIHHIKTRFLTQPFTPMKNDIRIEGYFMVITLLSLSQQGTLAGS
jgi:hypothetical protein